MAQHKVVSVCCGATVSWHKAEHRWYCDAHGMHCQVREPLVSRCCAAPTHSHTCASGGDPHEMCCECEEYCTPVPRSFAWAKDIEYALREVAALRMVTYVDYIHDVALSRTFARIHDASYLLAKSLRALEGATDDPR